MLPDQTTRAFTRLDVLRAEVTSCTRCGLSTTRTNTVFSRGTANAEVMFLGEGPGENEDREGVPFVGASGKLVDKMTIDLGFTPEEVYVCNVVKCRPPKNRKPETEEIAACLPYLIEQIGLVKPRVIIALGATATRALFGKAEPITQIRGKWKSYTDVNGRLVLVMPTYHPAYLLRDPSKKHEVWQDIEAVAVWLGRRAEP